jgi:hypothetical protein
LICPECGLSEVAHRWPVSDGRCLVDRIVDAEEASKNLILLEILRDYETVLIGVIADLREGNDSSLVLWEHLRLVRDAIRRVERAVE